MKFIYLYLVCLCGVNGAPLYGTNAPDVRPGEYIVGLLPGVDSLLPTSLEAVTMLRTYRIHTWTALMVQADEIGLRKLQSDSGVEYIEANSYNVMAAEVRSERGIPESMRQDEVRGGVDECIGQDTGSYVWGLSRTSSRPLPNFSTAQYWYDEDGATVDIYIVDSGVYLGHNDFAGRAWHGHTATDVRPEGDADLNGHGTHVAGTAGGTTYGVAKKPALIAVKVLGEDNRGTIRDFIEGVEWAVQHHKDKQQGSDPNKSVINLSLGAFSPSNSFDQAVEAAVAAGIPVAVAAMNDNRDACQGSPARVATAITVAASANTDTLPSFTNYGTCVDVIAPGSSVRSAYIGSPSASTTMSGTSMATPHVVGAVARYLSTFLAGSVPTPAQIMAWLENTSTKDVISLSPPKDTTPNRLLYAACA